MLISAIERARPGEFVDGRLLAKPVNAVVYRMRNPMIDELVEIPMMQTFGIFKVSAIMSGRTQVGVCVRFGDNVETKVTQGVFATFSTDRAKKNLGKATVLMKTSDFLIFGYESRGALTLKKLIKGRGYGG